MSSVQDGTVVHTTVDWLTIIGARCVVGHNAHLEGCWIGDDCLIGSGSYRKTTAQPGTLCPRRMPIADTPI
jgi:carbonic anhydrase/acetyltransferase-like protein (isoleucine patch superfamily)